MSRKSRNPVTARRGPSLNVILTAAVVVIAAAVIGGVLLANRGSAGPSADSTLRPADAHTLSTVDGDKVTVVEFFDFQCPACSSYYTDVTKKLEQDYRGRITLVPRNLPLDVHPLALPAALAAEAAGKQGKYAEMYHALYENYDSWALAGQSVATDPKAAAATFERFATTAGLDLERFRADLASPDLRETVDRDVADARQLGVTSTPTLFVNGTKFQPKGKTLADVDRELRARIDEELDR
ncbi:thioredoxin [Actinosynnema sp. NPDC047251]|uniref:DSBA oxidoreductase n=1 Tax=Saccharothrix espanaensis (strain ATCC 51144 / DSM 44229 / JCM 9112 / NBRC 15066 / NRRL 15764) TaxID=1179773 RepID=K0JXV1_SACES|nr:thioredoxin [Saccharothrix espanaensis]CCH30137.1 DSBA oxidoreductase [Saccharothrix espanaensis DSM 44229]